MKIKQTDKIDLLHFKIKRLQKLMRRLKQENENLKCCGNCKYNGTLDLGSVVREENCRLGMHAEGSCFYCEQYGYDEMKKSDRKIEI